MKGAMDLLARARASIDRVTPQQALEEQRRGEAYLIDVRMPDHRADQGELPGAIVCDLTVLPWRLDPTFDYRLPEATDWDVRWILLCRHSYSSSVAAAQLKAMGLVNATDVIGGVEAWADAGLPLGLAEGQVADVRP
ncbi:rhodanese-like domain-containing protein [Corynebacterium tapiri]|uniref:Rhodanese-like domain-containing protein n=1 Tax=Corynebacterium tapiri TaxID=1448266 RepID=A0A5C4U6E6_9CORY|nr:rhodanese-like domain-containing protein [Corynebacterium tapiri]TNL99354.1 rhodanese-like domain-containing protein [Corynebacterium tapiri]